MSNSEGYDTTFAVKRGTGTSQSIAKDTAASTSAKVTATSQEMTKADNAVVVTNTKKTVSPTGIALSVTPYASACRSGFCPWSTVLSQKKIILSSRN